MREFLVKHEQSIYGVLYLYIGLLWVIPLIVSETTNYPGWLILVVYFTIPIVVSVIVAFSVNGLEWICPKCGFVPLYKISAAAGQGGPNHYQDIQTNCERCGTNMTAMRKNQVERLKNLHSYDGHSYVR